MPKFSSTQLQMIWEKLEAIEAKQDTMRHELTRYKGFVGGIVATMTLMTTAGGLALSWLKQLGISHN